MKKLLIKFLLIFNTDLKEKYAKLESLNEEKKEILNKNNEIEEKIEKEKNIKELNETTLNEKNNEIEKLNNKIRENDKLNSYLNEEIELLKILSKSKNVEIKKEFTSYNNWFYKFKEFADREDMLEDEFELFEKINRLENEWYNLFFFKNIIKYPIVNISGDSQKLYKKLNKEIEISENFIKVLDYKIPIFITNQKSKEIEIYLKSKKYLVIENEYLNKFFDGEEINFNFEWYKDIECIVINKIFKHNKNKIYVVNYHKDFFNVKLKNLDLLECLEKDINNNRKKLKIKYKDNILNPEWVDTKNIFNKIFEIINIYYEIFNKNYKKNNRKIRLVNNELKIFDEEEDYLNIKKVVNDDDILDIISERVRKVILIYKSKNINIKNLENDLDFLKKELNNIIDKLDIAFIKDYKFDKEKYRYKNKEKLEIPVKTINKIETNNSINIYYSEKINKINFIEYIVGYKLDDLTEFSDDIEIFIEKSNKFEINFYNEKYELETNKNLIKIINIYSDKYNYNTIKITKESNKKINLHIYESDKSLKNIDINIESKELNIFIKNISKSKKKILSSILENYDEINERLIEVCDINDKLDIMINFKKYIESELDL